MCGIVGVIGHITYKEEQVFSYMLRLDTIRGPDSTGVIMVDRQGNSSFEKVIGTPWEFFQASKAFGAKGNYLRLATALIGHNRAATFGDVSEENAHPFNFKNIVGVHNGTLINAHLHNLHGHKKFDVDSEVLFHNINKNGLHKTIPKACGAYSIVYYDKKKKNVKFLRNAERPMQFRYSADGRTLFFASESWMIKAACDKKDVKLQRAVRNTKINQVYTAHPDEKDENGCIKFEFETKPLLGMPRPKPVSTYRGPPYRGQGYGGFAAEQSEMWDDFYNTKAERKAKAKRDNKIPGVGFQRSQNSTTKKEEEKEEDKKELAAGKMFINVYYPLNVEDIEDRPGYITMYAVETDQKVRLVVTKNDSKRKAIMDSDNDSWFKLVVSQCMINGKPGLLGTSRDIDGPFSFEEYDWGDWIGANGEEEEDDEENIETLKPKGFNGVVLTQTQFNEKIHKGCAWCGDKTTLPTEHKKIKWVNESDYVCQDEQCQLEVSAYIQ